MKKLTLILILFSNHFFAQDSTKKRTKEFYLTIADFSPLNIQLKYKCQIKNRVFFKVGLINLNASVNENTQYNIISYSESSYYSGGLQIGIEFRKYLKNDFTFFHGPNIGYSYSNLTSNAFDINATIRKQVIETNTASLPYTLGFIYSIKTHILIAAEINPSLNYSSSTLKRSQNTGFLSTSNSLGFLLDNRFGLISLIYRL